MSDEPEKSQPQVLVPVVQDSVPFYDRIIVAARLPDGRIAAALRAMCDALLLDRPSQLRRIRDDEVLSEQLIPVRVETEGGAQVMEMLTAWAIPTWLTGIKLSRIAPEKRAAILAFKREAADALYRHFSKPQTVLPAPSALIPTEPITQPEAPERNASRGAWIRYHEAMAAWLAWQEDIEQWRGNIESRLESHEAVLQLVPEILERLGPQTLTPEHQRTVQNGVKRLHEISGTAYATIYADLGTAFRVARYQDIRESEWPQVVEWFRARLDAAEKREKQ